MPTPRIAPGRLRDLGLINNTISIVAGRVICGRKPNVFTPSAGSVDCSALGSGTAPG